MVFDITHRKIFEEFYQILSDINQLIVRVENEEELLNKVCDILYNYTEFKLVVLGKINKSTKLFKPKIMLGGENHKKRFKQITVSVDEAIPEGQGTVGRVYRSKKIAVMIIYLKITVCLYGEAIKRHSVYIRHAPYRYSKKTK